MKSEVKRNTSVLAVFLPLSALFLPPSINFLSIFPLHMFSHKFNDVRVCLFFDEDVMSTQCCAEVLH